MTTPEQKREDLVAWRQRNPGYHREMSRIYRQRRKLHVCPGVDQRGCPTVIPGDRAFCHFHQRSLTP